MKDLVSIIVPNYNHEKYLPQRLASIFGQSYKNFEVILLDDNSTDNSRAILDQYKTHSQTSHCIFNDKNSGSPFVQWNRGIEMAKGKYIWIAESDDFCDTNFLKHLIEVHNENEDIALAYCQSYCVDLLGEITDIWPNYSSKIGPDPFKEDFVMDGNLFIEKFLIQKNVIPNVSSVLFKKDSLEKIMPLRIAPYLKYTADWFYYIQILCNEKVGFLATPLNYFRHHQSSVIARAHIENSYVGVGKMELQARRDMIYHLERHNPANLNRIKQQSKLHENHLYFGICKSYINSGKKVKAILTMIRNPQIIKTVLKDRYKKMNKVKITP